MQTKTNSGTFDIRWDRFELALSKRTHIMGVLNRTPDSFSDGGLFMDEKAAIDRIYRMVSEGADIIDIGGESTRPGAEPVSIDEELERTIPVIKAVAGKIDTPVSIDTYKPEVARAALKNGAAMINDITGLRGDNRMAKVAAEFDVPVIVMHIRNTPRTMQQDIHYTSLIDDILASLEESANLAVKAGVAGDRIIIDPGIGFGKTTEHNLEILNRLESFKVLKRPILIGVSRKSFIVNTLKNSGIIDENTAVGGRLMGTAASAAISIIKGANILRVHDVKEMVQVARIADAITAAS
ncbi:MAG: dihydropteroate synthase [Candidatus Omnitrophica bacterium]|nr:dihydropteroate synthase [Candidatus Omnitrophota bacterium]